MKTPTTADSWDRLGIAVAALGGAASAVLVAMSVSLAMAPGLVP